MMESDLQQQFRIRHDHQPQQNQPPANSGLMRYRSAPSSYFNTLMDRELCEQFITSSPETERIFAEFITSGAGATETAPETLSEIPKISPAGDAAEGNQQAQYNISSYSPSSQGLYQTPLKPPLPNQSLSSSMEGGNYSMAMNRLPSMKTGTSSSSNLVRHSSSPAGWFSQINIESEYASMRGVGNFVAGNRTKEDTSFSPTGRMNNFSPRLPSSSSGLMSPIAEIEDKNLGSSNPGNEMFAENRSNDFFTGFPVGSWDDSSLIADNITDLSTSETQNTEAGSRPSPLAHQLSLPNTSAEMNAIEKFLQFSDSVPCKIRAKRGFATHPRSIAERVRRTKISERMRKLQDLVPNMDKQTNTSDMLDLAVDYIKDLQTQVQKLSDSRAKCSCTNRQQ